MNDPLHILVIDDNPADLLLAQEAFAALGGAEVVTTAPGGPAALEALRRPDADLPDVVLLDVAMPVMSGFEVLAALKADPRLCLIPVVMLTTSQRPEDIRQAYTLHASSYLIKADAFAAFIAQLERFVAFWTASRFASGSSSA